jgi:hypothetical protein
VARGRARNEQTIREIDDKLNALGKMQGDMESRPM